MKLLLAFVQLTLGLFLGLLLFETLLRVNPRLLLRGMALPSPVDPPVQEQVYDVRFSDADLFYWRPELIRPVSPSEDRTEAHVHYYTDEFGFPNRAPVNSLVDIVVLGRSYSMGAQAADPWPRLLTEKYNLSVFNLSQPGSGIETKYQYYSKFGLRKHPRWLIIEVLPSMDIIGYADNQKMLIQSLPVPVIQQFVKLIRKSNEQADVIKSVYPLKINIGNRVASLSFFSYYLSSLTVDEDSIARSTQWQAYKKGLLNLVDLARRRGTCVALLYVPTKENLYFALADNPLELKPVIDGLTAWKLNYRHHLEQDNLLIPDLESMQRNVNSGRDLVARFANGHSIPFIDPTQSMLKAVKEGNDPYMVYDSHWSAIGHSLVADLVAQTLINTACP